MTNEEVFKMACNLRQFYNERSGGEPCGDCPLRIEYQLEDGTIEVFTLLITKEEHD